MAGCDGVMLGPWVISLWSLLSLASEHVIKIGHEMRYFCYRSATCDTFVDTENTAEVEEMPKN